MISRRNIRIKVMQLLYALEASESKEKNTDLTKSLSSQIDQSRELLVYLLYFLTEVTQYANVNAKHRASKNIVTAEDLNVNVKIAENSLLNQLLANATFRKAIELDKPQLIDNEIWVRRIYQALLETEIYQEYIATETREDKSESEIVRFIFTDLMLPNEDFLSFIEDHFPNWEDDADMMNQLVHVCLKKPAACNLQEMIGAEKWEYARTLLHTVADKKEYLLGIITPMLNNWDADRIASLDMVLIQMGISEFLYFETIPTKVTINEYVDIAKAYSTPQSGQFINGILDNIKKDLETQEKIHKVDFLQK